MGFKKHLKQLRNDKIAIYTFGRFQPPSSTHLQIFKKINEIQNKYCTYDTDSYIFTTTIQNAKKNPLYPDFKKEVLTKILERTGLPINIIMEKEIKNAWEALKFLLDKKYNIIYFVTTNDRKGDYTSLKKYAKEWSDNKSVLKIESIDRKSENTGLLLRNYAKENKLSKFIEQLPGILSYDEKIEIYTKINNILKNQ